MQIVNGEYCLDAQVIKKNNNEIQAFLATCNSTMLSQQWYYESYSHHLRHLSSDKCLECGEANTAGQGCDDLHMTEWARYAWRGISSSFYLSSDSVIAATIGNNGNFAFRSHGYQEPTITSFVFLRMQRNAPTHLRWAVMLLLCNAPVTSSKHTTG